MINLDFQKNYLDPKLLGGTPHIKKALLLKQEIGVHFTFLNPHLSFNIE